MASTEIRGRIHITCKRCDMVLWSAPVVVQVTFSHGTTTERKDLLDSLTSSLLGNARKVVDDHRARHLLHDGIGPAIDVQWLPEPLG